MTRMEVSCSRGEVRALSTLWYDEDRQTVHSNDFKPGGRWQAPAPGTVYEAVVEAACAAVR